MDTISLILILSATLISGGASLFIRINYKKYKQETLNKKVTGYDVAREILDNNNLSNVLIFETEGELSDHYDPSNKTIKLSHDIYHGSTIAAASVAAHECGHAIQDKEGYSLFRLRSTIVPIVNFVSYAGYFVSLLSLFFGAMTYLKAGIFMLVATLIFQLVTLPVEFDASERAKKEVSRLSLSNEKEDEEVKDVSEGPSANTL